MKEWLAKLGIWLGGICSIYKCFAVRTQIIETRAKSLSWIGRLAHSEN